MLPALVKKILIVMIILPVLMSLTSLGIRLPALDGMSSGTPKSRPRAVLQTQIKKCKEQIEGQILFFSPHLHTAPLPQQQYRCSLPDCIHFFQGTLATSHDSRAPPLPLLPA